MLIEISHKFPPHDDYDKLLQLTILEYRKLSILYYHYRQNTPLSDNWVYYSIFIPFYECAFKNYLLFLILMSCETFYFFISSILIVVT